LPRASLAACANVGAYSGSATRRALPRASGITNIALPNGLTAIGYIERDLPALIGGTLRQPRLLSGAPRHVGAPELDLILRDAMQYW
jgi:hypothetical protein